MTSFLHLRRGAIAAVFLICTACAFSQAGAESRQLFPRHLPPLNMQIGTDSMELPWHDNLFFQQGLGVAFIGIGHKSELRMFRPEDLGFSVYYTPKLAYEFNGFSSVCLGTAIQGFYAPKAGYGFLLPLTVGGSIGAGASEENEYEEWDDGVDVGGFINVGLGHAFVVNFDPDARKDFEKFTGPYIDGGVRLFGLEMKLYLLRAFKNKSNGFAMGIGFGYLF